MSDQEEILEFRRPETNATKAVFRHGQPSPGDNPKTSEPRNSEDSQRQVLPLIGRGGPEPFQWHDLRDEQPLCPVQIRLGASRLRPGEANPPAAGSIVVLDRSVNEPVEIVVAGEVVGWGQLVVAQNKLAIQVCQVKRRSPAKTA